MPPPAALRAQVVRRFARNSPGHAPGIPSVEVVSRRLNPALRGIQPRFIASSGELRRRRRGLPFHAPSPLPRQALLRSVVFRSRRIEPRWGRAQFGLSDEWARRRCISRRRRDGAAL